MKIVISKKSLLNVLTDVEKCVSKTETIPVTGSVLISTVKDGISVVSTDTEKGMMVKAGCTVEKEGSAAIPFKKIMGLVKELSSQNDIVISTTETRATITSGKSKFNISLINVSEFPAIDFDCNGGDEIVLKESDIKKIHQYVSITTSNDAVFSFLTGVCIVANDGKARCFSTDRRRVSEFICEYGKGDGFTNSVIVPTEVLGAISSIIGDGDEDVSVSTNYKAIFFRKGDKVMYSRLIDGKFPDYTGKIPKNSHIITLNHSEFVGAVKQIIPFVDKENFSITITTDGDKAKVSMKGVGGDAEVTIDAKQEGGNTFSVGMNCDYVSAFLRAVKGDKVILEVSDAKGGVVCKSVDEKGYLSIIMPLVG